MGADLVEQRWPAIAIAAMVAILVIAPRAAAGLVFGLALLPLVWTDRRTLLPRAALEDLLPKAALLFGAYLLFSIALSLDRVEAIGKTALFLGLAGGVAVAAAGFSRADGPQLQDLGRAAVTAFAVALTFLLVEEASGHAIKNSLYRVLPFLAPDAKHVRSVGDGLVGATYLTNRSIAMMVAMLGPMMLMARHVLRGAWQAGALAGLPILALVTTLASQHESSQLGLAAAAAIVMLGIVKWRAALWLVAAGWVAANALVVPAVQGLYAMNLHHASWLPYSAKARVILWNYTAEQVSRRPLLGVGLVSTRLLDERRMASAPTLPGHVFPQRTGPHAHNVYLQTWYELGLAGAILLTALGLALIAAIARLNAATRPFALATFAGAATIAAFSWGMWQPWFMAMFAIAAILVVIADAIVASGGGAGSPARPPRQRPVAPTA